MAHASEILGPLTRRDQASGRRVVTEETARIIADQCAAVADFEKQERQNRRLEVLGKTTSH